MSTPENTKTLEEVLTEYRKDKDFRVGKISSKYWGMGGIYIYWKAQHRALYANNIKEILTLGKFEKFMVAPGKNGTTQVWFYNDAS